MRLLHIIDGLEKIGGAEILLVNYINRMTDHTHAVVVLAGTCALTFNEDVNLNLFQLNFKGYTNIFKAVINLKNVIKSFKPDIIHSHLPLATFIARLAKQKNIPFFFSVHNNYSDSLKKTSSFLFNMEKILSSVDETAIFVSSAAKKDYLNLIKFRGRSFVLHNFITDDFFEPPFAEPFKQNNSIRLIAVGNVKKQKNYEIIIQSLEELDLPITLDIYGRGDICIKSDKVKLKGWSKNIHSILPEYDIYISASLYEGFGIAPLEAAAKGLPVILSDIEVFREVSHNKAIYFNPTDKEDLKNILRSLYDDHFIVVRKSIELNKYVNEQYRMSTYIDRLMKIYLS